MGDVEHAERAHATADTFSGVDRPTAVPATLRCIALILATVGLASVPACPAPERDVPRVSISLNGIPSYMNGSRTARHHAGTPDDVTDDYDRVYRLMVPQCGFTIDLEFQARAGTAVDPASLTVVSPRPLGHGAIAPSENLAPFFVWDGSRAQWEVAEQQAFYSGPNLLRVSIADIAGRRSDEVVYRFDVWPLEDALRPFDRLERWLLDCDRDLWTTTWRREEPLGAITIESVEAPNGIPDFDEAMSVAGFRSAETGRGAATVMRDGLVGTNAIMRHMLLEEIRGKLRDIFWVPRDSSHTEHSVWIDFALPTDPEAPQPDEFLPEGDFSILAIGGDHADWYGWAEFDPNNQRQNALITPDEGLFVTSLLRAVINTPIARLILGPILPGSGVPVGESDLDAAILAGDFSPVKCRNWAAGLRYRQLITALDLATRAIAAGAAHEIGHAVGLVADGFPPHGLFGGETTAEFAGPRTNSLHLDTPGNNLMAAGVHGQNLWQMIDLQPFFFNEMELAYLRGRLIYSPDFDLSIYDEATLIDLAPEEQFQVLQLPDRSLSYAIRVANKSGDPASIAFAVSLTAPVSADVSADLDRMSLVLPAGSTDTITLTFYHGPEFVSSAYVVRITGNLVGSAQRDAVAAIAFVVPN